MYPFSPKGMKEICFLAPLIPNRKRESFLIYPALLYPGFTLEFADGF
jgi:hypothetical protein